MILKVVSIAYSELFHGTPLGEPADSKNLLDLFFAAMGRFNVAALTSRSPDSQQSWSISEAAFLSEMYAYMQIEIEKISIFLTLNGDLSCFSKVL